MLGLPDHGFVAIPRDSIQCLPECNSTNKLGASFETPYGHSLVKPVEYVELIFSLKPNIWTALADEVPAWVSDKRNKTSVDRTVRWLDECIKLNRAGGSVFGSIVGGSSVQERERCALLWLAEVYQRGLGREGIEGGEVAEEVEGFWVLVLVEIEVEGTFGGQ
ncbi:uncharacterized protein LOC133744525 [Rosa rugosa]|uniref:uncharacterized protein LOC133744525 n=1 Tax=Rosa rugosa TaxID=74645 RepID=UPI002B402DD4|nr:uncharacterized protein LOC133744525 [Rosa rugosa]